MNELYLGEQASDPTKDNNGGPLKVGAEYFNNVRNMMRVYTSKGWQDVDVDAQTQAANATASASAAAGSAAGAAASAGASAASQAAALASQNATKTSETNSKTSETNSAANAAAALASQNATKASETSSKTSETNAAASAAHADAVATQIGNPVAKGGDIMTGDLTLEGSKLTSSRYGTGGALVLRSQAGAVGAPAAMPAGNQAGTVTFRGYDGANYQDVASMDAWVDAAVTPANSSGSLRFYTTPVNAIAKTERMRITAAGRILIGTQADNGSDLLQVAGSAWLTGGLSAGGSVSIANGNVTVNRSAGEGDLLLGQNDGYFYGHTTAAGWYSPTKGSFSFNFADGKLYVQNSPVWTAATFDPATRVLKSGDTIAGALTVQSGFNNTNGTIYNYGWGGSVGKGVYVFSQDGSKYLLYDGSSYTLAGGGLSVAGPVNVAGAVVSTSGQMILSGWSNNAAAGVIYFGSAANNKYLYYNGTSFNFSGGPVYVDGATVWHTGNLPSPAQTIGATFSGQVDHNSTLRMLGQNEIQLWGAGNTYFGRLRADSAGLIGFINQANTQWNMQLTDGGQATFRGQVWAANGGGRLCEDGNIYGAVWGGYLSNYLNNQFASRDANINGRAPKRNGNPNSGYVGSDTGNSLIINWDGNFRIYVDGQYGSALWGTHNFDPGSKLTRGARTESAGTTLASGSPPGISGITSSGMGGNVALTVSNSGNTSASAVMAFLRDGQFGGFFGLDTDNQWAVGGWSHGNVRYRLWHEGNFNPDSCARIRNGGQANGGYVVTDTGNRVTFNWSGSTQFYIDDSYQGDLVHTNNLNSRMQGELVTIQANMWIGSTRLRRAQDGWPGGSWIQTGSYQIGGNDTATLFLGVRNG